VQAVIDRLKQLGAVTVRNIDGVKETVEFPLPMGLGDRSMAEVRARK
jgi:4-hydroxy-3-methylbut-2-enyl diphosphate reductase